MRSFDGLYLAVLVGACAVPLEETTESASAAPPSAPLASGCRPFDAGVGSLEGPGHSGSPTRLTITVIVIALVAITWTFSPVDALDDSPWFPN